MSNITLISKDGEHEIALPEDEKAEITNLRAAGWATKAERTATAKAEKQADSAPAKSEPAK